MGGRAQVLHLLKMSKGSPRSRISPALLECHVLDLALHPAWRSRCRVLWLKAYLHGQAPGTRHGGRPALQAGRHIFSVCMRSEFSFAAFSQGGTILERTFLAFEPFAGSFGARQWLCCLGAAARRVGWARPRVRRAGRLLPEGPAKATANSRCRRQFHL